MAAAHRRRRPQQRPGVYLAGDGARILGADGAEAAGRLAALAVLADLGHAGAARHDADALRRARWPAWTASATAWRRPFPWPHAQAAALPDEAMVCRCEAITAGELRRSVNEMGSREVNRAKAFSRVGMGRCQGRFCGHAGGRDRRARDRRADRAVGRLRGQAPVKPLPMAAQGSPHERDQVEALRRQRRPGARRRPDGHDHGLLPAPPTALGHPARARAGRPAGQRHQLRQRAPPGALPAAMPLANRSRAIGTVETLGVRQPRRRLEARRTPIPTGRKSLRRSRSPADDTSPTRHTLLSSTPPKSRQPPGTRKKCDDKHDHHQSRRRDHGASAPSQPPARR